MSSHLRANRATPLRAPLLAVALILLLAPRARADRGMSTTREQPEKDRGGAILGAQVGALFGQPFSPLGTSYFVEVEAGYLLPYLHRLFAVTATCAFSAPGTDGSGADPRLPGGGYSYSITQQQLMFGLNVMAKIPLGRVVPYVGVGPRLFLVRTISSGSTSGGAAIPESSETSTEAGVGVPVGVDVLLGPGRLFVEMQLLYAATAQRSTGSAALGSLVLGLGYRLVL